MSQNELRDTFAEAVSAPAPSPRFAGTELEQTPLARTVDKSLSLSSRLATMHGFASDVAESERIARGAELSYRTGLSLDFTSADPGAVEKAYAPQLDWDHISSIAPVTAKALLEPTMMMAASRHGDILAQNEAIWGDLKADAPGDDPWTKKFTYADSAQGLHLGMKRTLDGLNKAGSDLHMLALERKRQALRDEGISDERIARIEAGDEPDPRGPIEVEGMFLPQDHKWDADQLKKGAQDALGNKLLDEKTWMKDYDQRKELYGSGMQEGASDIMGSLPTTGLAIAGSLAGGPVGGAALVSASIYGTSLEQYEKDPTVNKDRIRSAALFNALGQGILEEVGAGAVLKSFKPVSSWGKALKAFGHSVAGEGVTEYLQSYPERAALEYAKGLNPLEVRDMQRLMGIFASTEFQKDAAYQGLIGAISGGIMAAPGAGKNYRELQKQALAKTAGAEMGRKYPEAYERILSAQVDAGVVPDRVFLPAARLEGLFQGKGPLMDEKARDAFLQDVGVDPVDYASALDSGATVSMPFSKIHKFTARAEELLPHVQMTPEQEAVMSQGGPLAEVVHNYSSPEEDAALAEIMGKPLVDEERNAARDAIKRGLVESTSQTANPYTPEQAGAYANILDAMAATAAQRTGGSVLDWYRQFSPEFLGPMATTDDLAAARERAARPSLEEPGGLGKERNTAFTNLVREEGAETDMQKAAGKDWASLPLFERDPVLGHVWGRLDGKSLRRDYPGAYKEITAAQGRGIFKSAEKGGLPIDLLAAELVEGNLFQSGMGANELVERLKTPGKASKELFQPSAEEIRQGDVALKNDAELWGKSVDAFIGGTLPARRSVAMLKQTPLVLQMLGAKNLPVNTSHSTLKKVLVEKHKLPAETLKQVPAAMADPVMVFKSATVGGDLVMMLDLKDQHGATVIVPVALEQEGKTGYVAHIATSVYGQKNSETGKPRNQWFAGQVENGNLLYQNNKKSREWMQSSGLQLPRVGALIHGKKTVFTDADLVKLRQENQTLYQSAYHGSPHRFDKFSLAHVGDGAGNQSYGWGLYFAGDKAVAEHYRKSLQANEDGQLYEVDIPETHEMLDQDKPLKAQSSEVKKALKAVKKHLPSHALEDLGGDYAPLLDPENTGADFYGTLKSLLGGSREASLFLKSIGIKGMRYLDGDSRNAGEGSHNYVIFDDKAVNIINKFYQAHGDTNRAVISFAEDARAIIQFFQAADISSAGHEIGHLTRRILESTALMENAPEQLRADWRTACDFVGAKDSETWTTVQEEHFADAFLTYLDKGEAPSKSLGSTFRKLKNWLVKLYQAVTNNGVEVSQGMREVFDRLLATDAEIELARSKAGIEQGLSAAMVPKSRRERYAKALEDMNDAAATAMEKKLLGELSRKQGQWEKEGTRLADEHPGHQLLDTLAKEGGLELTPEMKERLWPEAIAAIQEQRRGKKVLEEGGTLDPEIIADEWGFTGQDAVYEMLSYLEQTPSKDAIRQDHVREQTELWRKEWTSDEIVMTDELAAALGQEAGILADLAGRHAVNGEALRRAVEQRLAGVAVDSLEQNISSLKAAYLSHAAEAKKAVSAAYQNGVLAGEMHQGAKDAEKLRMVTEQAEAKAAQAKDKADERLDRERGKRAEEALKAKEMQRRALAELKARYAAKAERTRILKDITRMAKAGPDKIDVAFGDQIRALAERFDLPGKSLAVKDPERLVPLPEFLSGLQSGIMEEAVPVAEWIVTTRALPGKKAGWKKLTLEQFRELHEAVTWLDHMGRTQKQLIGAQNRALVADVAKQCAESMDSLKSKDSIADYERKNIVSYKGAKHMIRRALAGITNLEYAFDAADGFRIAGSRGDTDGVHYQHIRGRLMDSRRQELTLQGKVQQSLETVLAPFRSKERTKRWDMPDVPLPDAVRKEWGAMPWNYERQIMVALNMGNSGNKKALMRGYGWTEEHLARITDSLTASDWQMVQGIWDTVNSLYPALNDTYRQINGLPMKKVEAEKLQVKGMVLDGGYFPLVADHTLSGKAAQLVEEEMFKAHADAMFMKPKLADGFTNARSGMVMPPRLAMSVLTTHLARTTHYITHAVAMHDIVKLTQHKEFASSFADKFGAELHEQINPWLRNIARPTQQLLTGWEKGLEYFRFMGTLQGLGLKFGTAAMQLTSMPASAQEIGWPAMAEGLSFVTMHRSEAFATIRELSPFMKDRANSLDRDIAANLDKFNPDRKTLRWEVGGKTYEAGWREFQEFCYLPMTFTDSITAYSSWWGAYKKKLGETGGDQQKSIDYADGAVIRAQSSAHAMNLTEAQRSNGLMKMCTMFMTFTMNAQNRMRFYGRGLMEGQISAGQYARHVFNDMLLQPAAATLILGLLKGGAVPDDPWEYWKDMRYSLLSGFPLLRDLQGFMEYGSTPGLINALASKGIGELFKSIKYGSELFTSDEQKRGDEFEKFMKAVANSAGFFAGVPTAPIWTFIDGARDLANGETDNPLRLFVRGEKKKAR